MTNTFTFQSVGHMNLKKEICTKGSNQKLQNGGGQSGGMVWAKSAKLKALSVQKQKINKNEIEF